MIDRGEREGGRKGGMWKGRRKREGRTKGGGGTWTQFGTFTTSIFLMP